MNNRNDLPMAEMSFGDHLEELRRRLWLSLIGVALAMVVCLFFGRRLVAVLQKPVLDALQQVYGEKQESETPDDARTDDGKPRANQSVKLYYFNVISPFMLYVKVSLIMALFVASPWIAWQLWQFVALGLYPREKRYVRFLAPVTVALFIAGVLFSYFILVKYGIRFLVNFGRGMGLEPRLEVNSQLMFVLLLSLMMGVLFQLPIVMLALTKMGIVDSATFRRKRKVFIIVALIVAAIITPTTDAVNLALATVPLIALFELGIVLCGVSQRRRARRLAG